MSVKQSWLNCLYGKVLPALVVTMLLALLAPIGVGAATQDFYVQDPAAKPGMIVGIGPSAGIVEPANSKAAESVIGILVAPGPEAKEGQVGVQIDGVANTLVSTLHGDIKVGDRISASAIKGTGGKATSTGWIVGIAQSSLDASTAGAVKANVTDEKGKKHDVYVASVPVLVKVTYYIKPPETAKKSRWVPEGVQDLADTIAGKHASPLAIIFSFALLLFGLVAATLIVTNAVRGGFAAIARQPLTKRLIIRQVMVAFTIAVAMLGVMFGGSLLILRLL